MSSPPYSLSPEDQQTISSNVSALLAATRAGRKTYQDIVEIGKLLEVNQETFERYKAEAWFTKAWFVISGKRGKLTEVTINNLGKIQIGVIQVLSEILDGAVRIKGDIQAIFSRIDKIQTQSLQLQHLLVLFNEKRVTKERETRKRLHITQALVGLGFVAGAMLQVPTFATFYQPYGVTIQLCVGLLLVAYSVLGSRKKKAKLPIQYMQETAMLSLREQDKAALEETVRYLRLQKETGGKRIFKIQHKITKLLDHFQLNREEQRLLFSLEYYLTGVDIEKTTDQETQSKKAAWLGKWQKLIDARLATPIVCNTDELFRGLEEVRQENLSIPKLGTILLEASIFVPYFPLGEEHGNRKLKADIDTYEECRTLCRTLGFSNRVLAEAKEAYEQALKEIPPSRFWQRLFLLATSSLLFAITGGSAATFIGGVIGGAMRLSGAAAVSAGLAFLGGGAITAGGAGMMGGTVVVIGGGAILGVSVGRGLANVFYQSKELALLEFAKLEAVAKVFLTELPNAREAIRAVIEEEHEFQKQMNTEMSRLRTEKDTSHQKDTLSTLEHNIECCKRAIRRLEEFLRKQSAL